jgi:hypothetical protein
VEDRKTKVCEFCGEPYFPHRPNSKRQKYCSRSCREKARRPHLVGANPYDPEFLRKIFDYAPDTGVLRWRVAGSRGRPAGSVAGCKVKGGYLHVEVAGKKLKVHRIAYAVHYGQWPASEVDHRNRVRDDNRIKNLRLATDADNRRNTGKPSTNSSGYKGVSWCKRSRKWRAQITAGKKRHIGSFGTREAAHAAYCKVGRELHGEFFNPG